MGSIKPPSASRQIRFHQLLVGARKTWLVDALSEALSDLDATIVKDQISEFAPKDAQQLLAAAGIRDEQVFPTPIVLEAKPTLVGYYRLLLGVPQKTFYSKHLGMGPFKSMEVRGLLNKRQRELLPEFCTAMSVSLAELVRQISPRITSRDVLELPLVTIGPQFQGANNNLIGQQATLEVFLSIVEIVKPHIENRTEQKLTVKNASGRSVTIVLANDPDVRVHEQVGKTLHNKLAIEIKGGTDNSNVHNRAGEAEKSHLKATKAGFAESWTIISTKGLDLAKLRSESPSTNVWFDASQVLAREGDDWENFRSRFATIVGIPLGK